MRWLHVAYEATIFVLALIVVWLVTLPDERWVEELNLGIWAIFAADYGIRLVLARDRKRFVREHVLDLLAIIPLDLLSGDDAFGLGRLLRLTRMTRLLRLLRAFTVLVRVYSNLGDFLRTNNLGYVLAGTTGVVLIGGVAIWLMEPEIGSVGDGMWWSIVTATTVGYGDIAPKTVTGRLIAGVLMLVGIGTISMITGTLATYFIHQRRASNPHVAHLVAQLERWDELSPEERRQLVAMLKALVDT